MNVEFKKKSITPKSIGTIITDLKANWDSEKSGSLIISYNTQDDMVTTVIKEEESKNGESYTEYRIKKLEKGKVPSSKSHSSIVPWNNTDLLNNVGEAITIYVWIDEKTFKADGTGGDRGTEVDVPSSNGSEDD